MVNKNADIDLLFRNGLKDFEVLPPPEAWHNILPVIRRKQKPVLLLRSAAVIAVLIAIGFLAYLLSNQMPADPGVPFIALQQESAALNDAPSDPALFKVMPASDKKTDVLYEKNILPVKTNESAGDIIYAVFNRQSVKDSDFTQSASNSLIAVNINTNWTFSDENTDAEYGKPVAADDIAIKSRTPKWSVTAMASPTYYLRPEMNNGDLANQISSAEQSRISYSGGVGFAYKISRKLSIQSGIYFSSVGNEVGNIGSFAGFRQFDYTKGDHNFEVLTSSGRIYTENSDVFLIDNSGNRVMTKYTSDVFDPSKANLSYINNSLFQNFSYLEMPVIVRYKFVDKTVDFNIIGGLSYNLLVNNSVHALIDGSKYSIGKTEGLNTFMVSSSLGMGMEYNLSEKISLNLEPTFRYFINPFSNIPGRSPNPYSFGVFSGFSYKF
jgi:hypothetical protein